TRIKYIIFMLSVSGLQCYSILKPIRTDKTFSLMWRCNERQYFSHWVSDERDDVGFEP
ncbi:unnamed protein product, partial [Allacma fusca]